MAWNKSYKPKTDEERKAEVDSLIKKLESGIRDVFDSDSYREYLKMCSKLHNYSANNILLILMQKPDASIIAGYNSWKNDFHRYVKKGEKGIRILAPVKVMRTVEENVSDPEGRPVFNPDGTRKTEKATKEFVTFRLASVFDSSQTEGEPLPSIAPHELEGEIDGFEKFFEAVKAVSPVSVSFDDTGNAKGFYSPKDKKIVIKPGMSDVQTAKTGLHECAHALLGHGDPDCKLDRDTRECEAESCAYIVSQHFGIDTSDYSFSYIAGWSKGRGMDELKSSLARIQKTASSMIDKLEEEMSNRLSLRDEIEHYVQASGYDKFFDEEDYDSVEAAIKVLPDHEPDDIGRAVSLRMWSAGIENAGVVNSTILNLFLEDPYVETWCRAGNVQMQKYDDSHGNRGVDICSIDRNDLAEYAGFYDGKRLTLASSAASTGLLDLSSFNSNNLYSMDDLISNLNRNCTESLFIRYYGVDEIMEYLHPEFFNPDNTEAYSVLNRIMEECLGLNLYGFYNLAGGAAGDNALVGTSAEILHSCTDSRPVPDKAAAILNEVDGVGKEYFDDAIKKMEQLTKVRKKAQTQRKIS